MEKDPFRFLDVAGLALRPDFITEEEERVLLEHIDAQPWNTALSRRTQHYGYEYNYTDKEANKPTTPIPSFCDYLIERLMEQNVLKERPDQLIVNEYNPGQGIALHTDHTKFFEDGIVSISLGASVVMDFSNGFGSKALKKSGVLPRRSALSMHGPARYKWRHGIAQRLSDPPPVGKRGRRVSLTFRKMKL